MIAVIGPWHPAEAPELKALFGIKALDRNVLYRSKGRETSSRVDLENQWLDAH